MESSITPDRASFRKAFRALKAEEDGKELRRDLVRNLKAIVEPAAAEARAKLLATPTKGLEHPPPPLLATVARKTKTFARATGRRAGVGVRVPDDAVERFPYAARRLNDAKWRHPLFGNRRKWFNQTGSPGWLTATLDAAKPGAQAAVAEAVAEALKRLERRSPR